VYSQQLLPNAIRLRYIATADYSAEKKEMKKESTYFGKENLLQWPARNLYFQIN
jgi:hypothetical protein